MIDYGFNIDVAAPIGGDSVIISFFNMNDLHDFVNGDWKVLNHVLSSVQILPTDFAPSKCIMYLDFMGLPPVIIYEPIIRDMAARFGCIVAIDYDFVRPDRLDVVSCLVPVPLGTTCRKFKLTIG